MSVFRSRWIRLSLALVALLTVLVVLAGGIALRLSHRENSQPRLNGGNEFSQLPLALNGYNVFDTGVVDLDGDDYLDIFSVNHSAQQQFFLNDGQGNFPENQALAASFSQDHQFAFAEDADTVPDGADTGISLYRLNRWLYIKNHLNTPAEGSIQVSWPLEAEFVGQADQSQMGLALNNELSTLTFSIAPGDTIRILGQGDIVELPHALQFDQAIAAEDIHIGRQALSPASPAFTLNWRDRHAMAWTDLDNNGLLDAYISRGGVRGRIELVSRLLNDELYLQTEPGIFQDDYAQAGFVKGVCPGREADWVDVDNDGLLDLHVVCGRQRPDFPNQLWQQQPDGTFKNVAEALSLDYSDTSFGVWFDVNGDGRNDYLALQPDGLSLYTNTDSGFSRQTLMPVANISHYGDIALGDPDADGDIDAFIASGDGSVFLHNNRGALEIQPQLPTGLPANSVDASWVDVNADGLLDLHLVPQGVYLQNDMGGFEPSGQMVYAADPKLLVTAACNWFDTDNDGVQDAVCHFTHWPDRIQRLRNKLSKSHTPPLLETVELWKHQAAVGNRLSFDLEGPENNPQAIGASLLFETDDGRKTASLVGQAEGARYSQGHYRVYFSPGESALQNLTIRLPGHEPQTLSELPAGVLHTLQVSDQGIRAH